jgi:hypothetical protein
MKKLRRALFETLLGKMFIGALIIMGTALLEEAFAINEMLSKPFKLLAEWKAEGTFEGRLKFVLLLILYLSPLTVIYALLFKKGTSKQHEKHYYSRYNYEKMIAEVKETVNNRQAPNELKADKIEGLFRALIDDVCNLFQVQQSDVRAVLVVNNNRGKHRLTGWRWGRPCTPDQERMDYKAIDVFLETERTYPIWEKVKEHFDHSDSDTLLFFRNEGSFRLGCLIAIANSIDVESHINEWEQIVRPFTMLVSVKSSWV